MNTVERNNDLLVEKVKIILNFKKLFGDESQTETDVNSVKDCVISPSKMKKVQLAVDRFVLETFPNEYIHYNQLTRIRAAVLARQIQLRTNLRNEQRFLSVSQKLNKGDEVVASSVTLLNPDEESRSNQVDWLNEIQALMKSLGNRASTRLSLVVSVTMALFFDYQLNHAGIAGISLFFMAEMTQFLMERKDQLQ